MTARAAVRTRRFIGLVSCALVLSACAGIPTSGPIQQGPSVGVAENDPLFRVIPQSPQVDATPEQLVRGFQNATASVETGYKIAKEYLTDGAASVWDPKAGVRVTDGKTTYALKGNVVSIQGGLTATINATGEYAVEAPGTQLDNISYGVTKVNGQWRISTLPSGLVLSPSDISRSYRTYDLYFFTRDFSTLVPAPITVPVTSSAVATVLVQSLLQGATPWIAPAVSSAFPEGTRLLIDAVPVEADGVADVELSPELLGASDETRQKLSAQLVWTLRQVPGITGVRMTVNGQPVTVTGKGPVQPIGSWPLVDPDALSDTAKGWAVDPRGLLQLNPDGSQTVVKLKAPLTKPGVSLDSTQVAGVGADKASLWISRLVDGATPVLRYTGTDLSRPSWDRYGDVWVVDRGRGLVLVAGDEKSVDVPIVDLPPDVTSKSLLAVSVSRDGTRIALLVKRKSKVEPLVARIERDGQTVRVAAPRRIDASLTNSTDLAWLDADTLVVLGSVAASSLEVHQLSIGYSSSPGHTLAPAGAVTLAAAPQHPILVGAGTTVVSSSGSLWVKVTDGAFPVYPG